MDNKFNLFKKFVYFFFYDFFDIDKKFKINSELKEHFNNLLYREEIAGENFINRLSFIALALLFFQSLIEYFITDFSPVSFSIFYVGGAYFLYSLIMFCLLKMNIYKPFFKYMNVIIFTSMPTFVLIGYSYINSWLHSLRSVSFVAYIIVIIAIGFYQRPGIIYLSSILAVIEYTALSLYAILLNKVSLYKEETFYMPVYSIQLLVSNDLIFLLVGFFIAQLCIKFRVLLRRTLYTEAEKYDMQKTKEEIELASKIKTNLFINLSHETKTPLTLISNYLDKYIKQYGITNELHIIKQNIDKLLRDMVNFLDIEKLERGQIFYNHNHVFKFSDLLNKKIPFIQALTERKNIRFNSKVEDSLYIQADPIAIDRIINNLIDNAVKYTPNNGIIDISLQAGAGEIILTVKDNGMGISDDQKNVIFQPYYQITHSKRNIQGIGMGLFIVKKIIESLSGRITLESNPDSGSTFRIYFKKHILKENDIVITEIESSIPIDNVSVDKNLKDTEQIKKEQNIILIVEDNIDMLEYLLSNLQNEYNVFQAVNGREALNKLQNIPKPDIIISDIMMDVMDGYRFFEELMKIKDPKGNEIYRDIPFLFLTAIHSQEEKVKSLAEGAVDFISKPFIMNELKAKIKALLKLKKAQRESDMNEFEGKIARIIRENPGIDNSQDGAIDKEGIIKKYNITAREKEIVDCIVEGLDNKEISDKLFISLNTVKRHIQNIYEKCNVANKIELFKLMKIKK